MNHTIKILLQEDEVVHQQLLDMNYYKDDEGEFDYLLNMNIGGFRKKNVDKLTSKIDDLRKILCGTLIPMKDKCGLKIF